MNSPILKFLPHANKLDNFNVFYYFVCGQSYEHENEAMWCTED